MTIPRNGVAITRTKYTVIDAKEDYRFLLMKKEKAEDIRDRMNKQKIGHSPYRVAKVMVMEEEA